MKENEQTMKRTVYVPTTGEEIANTVSHGVMSCLALPALPFAAVWVSVSVFVVSIFLMFLASTLYHSMTPHSRHKEVFHILDHIFIYVAIAGSYTPIALSVIGGWQGIVITAVQWTMVLFGIFYKSLSRKSIPAISLTVYLVMGWTILFFLPVFLRQASAPLAAFIAIGPQGIPLSPFGLAPAHQSGRRRPFYRNRLLPLLIRV